ncbi:uncharacterized protein UV8b_08072 [Ustilaginoidea virens]|uniref:Uncharacterized protein n=1 Tax=Ustilaginoidea virens TaxID=1159556 RepID=A0A8E5HYF5_USTVR|nr:uncharacterized protein UV8b_08072 [Ustilaginoidea virens]QUC23831.1 hypothetical protein UV8b_08072 [Ustilaginoidea virens]
MPHAFFHPIDERRETRDERREASQPHSREPGKPFRGAMLSKSLDAARAAVRDLFRSGGHRHERWTDSAADEWGMSKPTRPPPDPYATARQRARSPSLQSSLTGKHTAQSTLCTGGRVSSTLTRSDRTCHRGGTRQPPRGAGGAAAAGPGRGARAVQRAGPGWRTEGAEAVARHDDPDSDPDPDPDPDAPDETAPQQEGTADSTLFAYAAMSGAGAGAASGPWARRLRDKQDPLPSGPRPRPRPDRRRRWLTRRAGGGAETYDISDDEGDPGRVSPRTFRLWATGCSAPGPRRDRLASPSSSSAADDDDDEPDPADDASASSAASSLARARRAHLHSWHTRLAHARPSARDPLRPPGAVVSLTSASVTSALSHPSRPSSIPPHVQQVLRHRHQLLLGCEHAEAQLLCAKRASGARVKALEALVAGAAASSSGPREPAAAAAQRERDDIYRHVEGHLASVEARCRACQGRVAMLVGEVERLAWREEALRSRLGGMGLG